MLSVFQNHPCRLLDDGVLVPKGSAMRYDEMRRATGQGGILKRKDTQETLLQRGDRDTFVQALLIFHAGFETN